MLMPAGGESSNWINTLIASVGGGMIMLALSWVFKKSEDSASRKYVDESNSKLKTDLDSAVLRINEDLKKKVDKDDYKEDIAEVKVMLNTLINLHIKP